MKSIKSILAVTAIAALFTFSVFATEPLLTPRLSGGHKVIAASDVKDADHVHDVTTTGNAAKAKMAGHPVVTASTKADPNLLVCERVGKATCNANPCDGKMVAICCKK